MAKWVARILGDDQLPKDINGQGDGPTGKNRFDYLDGESLNLLRDVYGYDHDYEEIDDLEFTMTSGVKVPCST